MKWFNPILWLAVTLGTILFNVQMAVAQTYLDALGNPTFGVNFPVEDGYIDVANGDLHLSIPLTTLTQRGKQSTNINLVYDSRIWSYDDQNGSWDTTGGWGAFGAGGIPEDATLSFLSPGLAAPDGTPGCYQYSNFVLTDSQNTAHPFSVITDTCYHHTMSGYATDGSGYYLVATDNDGVVYDNQGNTIYNGRDAQHLQIDTNGNYSSFDESGNLIDTDGRTPATLITDDLVKTYQVAVPGGLPPVTYTITLEQVFYHTDFGFSDAPDGGSFYAIQSIQLPDGASYSLNYDSGTTSGHYGEMTSITLPTGATIQYNYDNFTDASGNINRWVTSRVAPFGTTRFTPKVDTTCIEPGVGCLQDVSVVKPSSDITDYTFTVNDGAWNTTTDYYTPAYLQGVSPVMTAETAYSPCDPATCVDPQDIQTSSITTTFHDAQVQSQTLYDYGDQQGEGKPTKIRQWDYYTGSPGDTPTRETDITYGETVNYALLPTEVDVLFNGSGFSTAKYCYDEAAQCGALATPSPISGLAGHQTVSEPRGNVTTVSKGPYMFTGTGLAQWNYTYDDTGALLSVLDPNGNTTSFNYDATDTYVTKTTRPQIGGAQHISTAQYDASTGLPTQQVDENGQTTSFGYDSVGRPSSVTYPDGGSLSYSYPEPEIETVARRAISPTVFMTQTTCNDTYGRVSSVTTSDPGGDSKVSYTYDANGRVASVTNPERPDSPSSTDGMTTYAYDWTDRYTTVTKPDGNTVQYSRVGNTTTVIDENGNQKKYQYDAFNNLIAVFEPDLTGSLNWETDYTLDINNAVTDVKQKGSGDSSQWRERMFAYDVLGRLTQESTPEAGVTSYQYDANGNLKTVTATGHTVNYTYDALNRPVTKSSTGSGAVSYTYSYDTGQPSCHADGRLTTATASSLGGSMQMSAQKSGGISPLIVIQPKNSTSYCYDAMGRLSQETWSFQNRIFHVSAGYDYAGDLTQLTYPDNRVVSNSYGTDGRLYNVAYTSFNGQSQTGSYFTPAGYAPTGQLTAAAFGNGVQLTAGYNSRKSLTSLGYATQTGILWSKSYLWAANARNLQTVTDLTGAVTPVGFTYDPLNRIAGVSGGAPSAGGSGVSETYTLDAWGNLQQTGNFNLSAAYTVDNQLPTADGYTYDGVGDLTGDGSGDSYGYDTDGHLILSNGTDAYNYGADGHMVYSVTAAGETDNVYLGDLLVGKYQPGPANWTDMIYGGGSLIATVAGTADALPNYRLTDHLGSLALLTDSSANVLESNVLVPYGEQLSGSSLDSFLYTGFEREPDTGTDRSLTRQYASTQGRWLTPDLYHGSYDLNDPQTFNRYSYVRNNPLAFIDPTGLCTGEGCSDCDNDDTVCVDGGSSDGPVPCNSVNCPSGDSGSIPAEPGGGGSGPAPSKPGQPKDCSQILKGAAVTVGLDAAGTFLGAVPGSGAVLVGLQVGVGLSGAANSAYHGDVGGTMAGTIGGAQLSAIAAGSEQVGWTALKTFGGTVARALPVAGSIISAGYFYKDATEALDKYQACKAGVGG